MSEFFVTVIGTSQVIQGLKDVELSTDVEAGEPVPYDSLSDALDSPLGAEEIRQVLEILELVFKTGGAFFVFAKALIDLLRIREGGNARLVRATDGMEIATVTAESDPAVIASTLERASVP